ncbi:MAG: hypothetical protein JXJ17_17430 [Anaerolineae bacterium]|nr:hypothetical protein [Anaerolineae bacterium]
MAGTTGKSTGIREFIIALIVPILSAALVEVVFGRADPCLSRWFFLAIGSVSLIIFLCAVIWPVWIKNQLKIKSTRFLNIALISLMIASTALYLWQPFCDLVAVDLVVENIPSSGRVVTVRGGETIKIDAQDFCPRSPAELSCKWTYIGDGRTVREAGCTIEIQTGSDRANDLLTVITHQKCCSGQITEALVIIPETE